jgi:uncharacterized protein (TIGR02996 family)
MAKTSHKTSRQQAKENRKRPANELASAIWPAAEMPFVRAIHANPFDDVPRLVFADWLEERGDVRAEFIRVQCRLAGLRVRDPEYAALAERSDKLVDKHRARWLRGYPPLLATRWGIEGENWRVLGKRRHHFTRGLPAMVQPRSFASFLRGAPLLFDELGMHEVHLILQKASEVPRLANVPQLSKIDALIVQRFFDFTPVLNAPGMAPVVRLNLTGYDDIAGLRRFLEGPKASRLRWVQIDGFGGALADVLRTLLEWDRVAQLDTLVLRGTVEFRFYDGLMNGPRLEVSQLAVHGMDLAATRSWKRIVQSPGLANVCTLAVEEYQSIPASLSASFPLPPAVRTLRLKGWRTSISEPSVAEIVRSPSMEQIEVLDLTDTGTSDDLAEVLASARSLGQLRVLRMPGHGMSTAGCRAIVHSKSLAKLESVELSTTQGLRSRDFLLKRFP